MKILILGAGLQGSACAYDLLNTSDATVTLADIDQPIVPAFLDRDWGERLTRLVLDVKDEGATREEMRQNDVVLSALPYYLNDAIAKLSVQAGAHYADLGGNTHIVRAQLELDRCATSKRLYGVPDCGLAPGLVNVLAAQGIERFDEVDAVRIYVGGLPQHPEPPLNYQVVYSLEGALDYYTTPSSVIRGGQVHQVEALSEIEDLTFPSPIGRLEAFHTAGGISTMPWDYAGRVQTMEYKTLRYPGHAGVMRPIRDLGLLDRESVKVNGASVSPRALFVAVVGRLLERPDGHDLVVARVTVTGRRAGNHSRISYQLVDRFDVENGISAMMRTTAFSLSIVGQFMARNQIGKHGFRPAHLALNAQAYIRELDRRGIVIQEETERLERSEKEELPRIREGEAAADN